MIQVIYLSIKFTQKNLKKLVVHITLKFSTICFIYVDLSVKLKPKTKTHLYAFTKNSSMWSPTYLNRLKYKVGMNMRFAEIGEISRVESSLNLITSSQLGTKKVKFM